MADAVLEGKAIQTPPITEKEPEQADTSSETVGAGQAPAVPVSELQ